MKMRIRNLLENYFMHSFDDIEIYLHLFFVKAGINFLHREAKETQHLHQSS